jgi:hypothetical protein
MKELKYEELKNIDGGFLLLGSSGVFWSSKWFWRGVGIGAAPGTAGDALALSAEA